MFYLSLEGSGRVLIFFYIEYWRFSVPVESVLIFFNLKSIYNQFCKLDPNNDAVKYNGRAENKQRNVQTNIQKRPQ